MRSNTWRAPLRRFLASTLFFGGTFDTVQVTEPLIALSFDDGPDRTTTPLILSVLRERGAHATFFVAGEAAAKARDVIDMILSDGHEIAIHGWSHSARRRSGWRDFFRERREIRRTAAVLKPVTCEFYRPPYGHEGRGTRLAARLEGLTVAGWSASGHDWQSDDATTILERVHPKLRPGAIVLLHDGLLNARCASDFDRGPTVEALKMLLDQPGPWTFVSVGELVRAGTPQRRIHRWRAPETLPPLVPADV